jgi:hypothetical protein
MPERPFDERQPGPNPDEPGRGVRDLETEYPAIFLLHGESTSSHEAQTHALPWQSILSQVADGRTRAWVEQVRDILDEHPTVLLRAQDGAVLLYAPVQWQARHPKVYVLLVSLVYDLAADTLQSHLLTHLEA